MNEITTAQIEAHKDQQRKLLAAELAKLLEKYNCNLVATPQIVNGVIVASIDIISK
jgi:hypothetical protein